MVLTLKREKRVLTALILTVLMIGIFPVLMPNIKVNATPGTKIVILPVSNTFYANQTLPGSTFVVNVTVAEVTDLQNWQIKLTWNSTLLQYVNIVRPSDHVFSGAGHWVDSEWIPYDMQAPAAEVGPGYVMWGCTYINGLRGTPDYWTFNGTGTLCRITLRIRSPPTSPATCNLTLVNKGVDTFLLNGDVPAHDIDFTMEDGIYTYIDELKVKLGAFGRLLLPSELIPVDYGGTVTFTANITIEGVPPYKYQWFFGYPNGTLTEDTDAENDTSWTTPPIIDWTGRYNVTIKVTDTAGLTSNATALLEVRALQAELSPLQPWVNVNDAKTFTATITGGIAPYTIKWYRNGTEQTAVQGQTEVSFTFTQVGIETVKVNVTDSTGKKSEPFTTVHILFLPPSPPIVKVIPVTPTYYTNETKVTDKITLNATVQGVTDLQNWQIKITWDPTLLSYSYISLPDDHVFAASGKEMQLGSPETGPDYVLWGCTYINGAPGTTDYWTFNGTGTLCQLELEIIRQPNVPQSSCVLGFVGQYADTFIANGTLAPAPNTIPFSIENGTYTYVLVQLVPHTVLGYTVTTYSNTSIIVNSITPNSAEAYIELSSITGAPGTGAYVNITLPKELIWGPWMVYRDGIDVNSSAIITEDATNTYVYIEFTFEDYDTVLKIDGTGMLADTQPPLIGTPTQSPTAANVQWNQPVRVSVSVTDAMSGVKNVTLYYTNDTTWYPIPMTLNATTSLWDATILGHVGGTQVKYYIEAFDNSENRAQNDNTTQYFRYTVVPDTTPPVIYTPTQSPLTNIQPNQQVRISVNVTDTVSGVKNVTLYYANDTAWYSVPMVFNSTTSLWQATIPGFALGTQVKYYIQAFDNAENMAVNNNATSYFKYPVVPEFSPIPMLIILMTVSMIAVLIATKKPKTTKKLI